MSHQQVERAVFTATTMAALISAFILSVTLTGCGGPPPGAGGPPPQGTPQVGFVVLQSQPVALTTELPGRTAAVLVADVRPQVTGLVKSRNFAEGGEVKAGALLYQIDPATYKVAVDSAQAALAKASSTLASARLKADRNRELVAIKAVSQQDFEDADASLQQAQADVATAKATLDSSRINLDYTRVTAPVSGRIGKSSVTPGALVTANQTTALATVQKLDPMYVDVTQSSTALLRLKRALAAGELAGSGNAARVKLLLEDGSAYPHEGKLQFSDVTVDQTTGAVTLRAVFPNPKADLLPGMYVRAVLEEGVKPQALLVPQPAVSRDAAGKPTAYVVGDDGKLQLRELRTERAIGDQWLVSDGLKAGERLVVDGQQRARPGIAVDAVPFDAAAKAQKLAAGTSTPPGAVAAPAAPAGSAVAAN